MLFGCLCADPGEVPGTLDSMRSVLRASPDERARVWTIGSFGIGIIERMPDDDDRSAEPVRGADGSSLWMSGEAFAWRSHGHLRTAAESRTAAFRSRLLNAIITHGPGAVRDLDGEYQIAVLHAATRSLLLLNDRFGALPLYIASASRSTAFAGGVRGVLVAPGIAAEPDGEAIREAVTFGGYRLGGRTNVRGVSMVSPASAVTISPAGVQSRRYWTWSELRDGDATDADELLEQMRETWSAAIARRLDGARRPGLTLSGGLDSRAILAEVTRQATVPTTALTYGVPHCDDVTIARRAARASGARWDLYELYGDDWLARRSARVLETDGLMDLVDLMHTEPLAVMPSAFDLHLSGYIGDAVAGSTLFFTDRPEDFLATMPYYGGELAMPYADAVAKASELIAATPGPARFAPYEHKLPQSTNRITAAARPFATVRRPFVDYAFFDVCQRVPAAWRARQQWRERWLVSTYPELFARIPNQQTGVPPQSSHARWQVARAARFGWRQLARVTRAVGLPASPRDRTFHPDERYWSRPSEREAIERTILRADSLSCEMFGRARVQAVVRDFFEHGAAPVQVIGALYVFEHYHQNLAASLRAARQDLRPYAC